jgi:hypothetical protein
MPATSASLPRLLFLLQPLTVLMKQARQEVHAVKQSTGNTKRGSITVLLTSCLTGLESAVCQLTIVVFIFKTD